MAAGVEAYELSSSHSMASVGSGSGLVVSSSALIFVSASLVFQKSTYQILTHCYAWLYLDGFESAHAQ